MTDFVRVICALGLIISLAYTVNSEDEQQAWAILGLCLFALVLLLVL